jgi:hypothetical protein
MLCQFWFYAGRKGMQWVLNLPDNRSSIPWEGPGALFRWPLSPGTVMSGQDCWGLSRYGVRREGWMLHVVCRVLVPTSPIRLSGGGELIHAH